ncbi:hypothetical protein BKA93DRAFT_745686 [Sparassis latifolia]
MHPLTKSSASWSCLSLLWIYSAYEENSDLLPVLAKCTSNQPQLCDPIGSGRPCSMVWRNQYKTFVSLSSMMSDDIAVSMRYWTWTEDCVRLTVHAAPSTLPVTHRYNAVIYICALQKSHLTALVCIILVCIIWYLTGILCWRDPVKARLESEYALGVHFAVSTLQFLLSGLLACWHWNLERTLLYPRSGEIIAFCSTSQVNQAQILLAAEYPPLEYCPLSEQNASERLVILQVRNVVRCLRGIGGIRGSDHIEILGVLADSDDLLGAPVELNAHQRAQIITRRS